MVEQLNAHMETDDNDNEARIASLYRTLTIHDPEILSVFPRKMRRTFPLVMHSRHTTLRSSR